MRIKFRNIRSDIGFGEARAEVPPLLGGYFAAIVSVGWVYQSFCITSEEVMQCF